MKELDFALYEYLTSHSTGMTEEWLSRRDKKAGSLYSSDASPELVKKLREQNRQFIENLTKVLIEEEEEFKKAITPWILSVSTDRAGSNVPLHSVIEQFGNFRQVILDFMEKYAAGQEKNISHEDIFRWNRKINLAFDRVIDLFSKHYFEINNKLISVKEKIILELSSPIIPVTQEIGVLPLIGEIDIERAGTIMESVLTQCAKMRFNELCIDLSGVPEMDAAVACQISKVIKGLNLLGVKAILSGVRPEVAKAAIEQGINFNHTEIEQNLAAALGKTSWKA